MKYFLVIIIGTLSISATSSAMSQTCDYRTAELAAEKYLTSFYKNSQVYIGTGESIVEPESGQKGFAIEYVEVLPDDEYKTSYVSKGKAYVYIQKDGSCDVPFGRGTSMRKARREQ